MAHGHMDADILRYTRNFKHAAQYQFNAKGTNVTSITSFVHQFPEATTSCM